jgi:hypothetical protein
MSFRWLGAGNHELYGSNITYGLRVMREFAVGPEIKGRLIVL